MNKDFLCDYYRMTGEEWSMMEGLISLLLRYDLRYLYLIRKDTFNKLGYKAKINTHTTSYIN